MKKILSTIGVVSGCLLFSAIHSQVKAQTRIVTGTVNNGEKPIAGATISQQGTTQMTITSSSGTFTLQITGDNPVIIIRHPEYNEQKIILDGRSNFRISLTEKVKSIEEVVLNAGYYNVKAKESTGSIAKVTAKDIENQPVNNVLSAVQGRMAGVSITQNSGTPGGGFDVQIRGRNSLRNSLNSLTDGNAPLYVIDGVPLAGQLTTVFSTSILPLQSISPLNSINPNDIESIEILKDADATAIYGSRGGNGVVLITTRKAKSSALKFNVNSSQTFSRTANKLEMMNTDDYIVMRKQAYANAGVTIYPANAYDINGSWDQTRYTDWQKVLIGGTAEGRNIQASVSGGSGDNNFLVSGGYSEQGSVFQGDDHYRRTTVSTHYNHRSADRRFSLGLTNTLASTQNNIPNTDFTNRSLSLSPNAPALYDGAGHLNWGNKTFNNPLGQLQASYLNKTHHINQNAVALYRMGKGFNVKLNAGFTLEDMEEYSLLPHTMYTPTSASGSSPAYSSSSRGTSEIFSYILEPQLGWTKKHGESEWNVLTGVTFQESNAKTSAVRGRGYASNSLLRNIAAATTITVLSPTDVQYRYAAFFGRVNYQYKNRYIMNLTARRDGSSRFGSGHRYANFGAVGAAWLFSEEPFLKDFAWLSFGKLRGSYGITGSDAIGDFQFTDTYQTGYNAYDGLPGLYPARLYNPDFSWEKTNKLEAAVELGLFDSRVHLSTAWYRNRSSNQLVGIPLPAITGFNSILSNLAATVENSGFEIELGVTPVKSRQWQWTSSFNLSVPQNKLIAFPGLEGSTYANRYVLGESINAVRLLDYQGINPQTGHYLFTDFNGDGKITSPDDAKALRNLEAQYFGGFENSFTIGKLSLSFLLQFVKQKGWNYFRTMGTPGLMLNQPAVLVNVWSPTNPAGIIMPYTTGSNSVTNELTEHLRNSTAAVEDASFVRLKNIQLNYQIPFNKSFLQEATVYVQGQNLLTWTEYFGLDPESVTSGFLPPLKSISMGLQLTF